MLYSFSRFLLYCSFLLLPLTFIRVYNNLSVSDLLIFISFITLAISQKGKAFLFETTLTKNEFLLPLLIFSLGFFLSLNNSEYPLDSFTAYLQIVFIFLFAYPVLSEVVKDEKQIKIIAILLLIPGVVVSILMLLIKFIGLNMGVDLLAYEGWAGRFSYGGMEPNIPGRIILQNIPLLTILSLKSKSLWGKVISILLIVFQMVAIILTSSRSNMLTFVFGISLFLIFFYKSGRRIRVRYILYTGIIMFASIAIFYNSNPEFFEKPLERYGTILNANKSASSMERIEVIDKGLDYLNINPVIGLGMGNSYLYTKVSLHNPILLTWLENGIFGIIGFTGFYLLLLFQGYKNYKFNFKGNLWLIALTIIMITMVFGDMFMANSYKRVLWLPALLGYVYSKKVLFPKVVS